MNNQRGNITFMMLLAMTILLGATAMVIDLGYLMFEKQKLSDAVDAAALAGAQDLFNDTVKAKEIAIDYANRNGVMNPIVTIDTTVKKLTVEGEKNVPFFFAKIFGIDGSLAKAKSIAQVKPISSAKGIVPLSVVAPSPTAENYGFRYGVLYTLKYDPNNAENGNFGPLSFGSTGASTYEQNLLKGYTGGIKINDVIKTETGNMSGPTERAIKERINLDTYKSGCETYELAKTNRNCSRIIYIPVIDTLKLNGRDTVTIIGFASFYVESVGGSGNDSLVTGRFMKSVYSGDWAETNTRDYGLYAVKLVE